MKALNAQFASFVARNGRENTDKLWDSGLRDYLKYAQKLRRDYNDVLVAVDSSDPDAPAGRHVCVRVCVFMCMCIRVCVYTYICMYR